MYHNLEALTQQPHNYTKTILHSTVPAHISAHTTCYYIYIADQLYDLSQSMRYCGVRR